MKGYGFSLATQRLPPTDLGTLAAHRFPFRDGEPAEIRRVADAVLRSIEPMLFRLARRHAGTAHRADLEDAVQETALSLYRYHLPRFDQERGVKLSTFLHKAAVFCLLSVKRTRERYGRCHPADLIPDLNVVGWSGWDVERLVATLRRDPARFLPKDIAVWAGRLLALPNENIGDAARALGIGDRRAAELNKLLPPAIASIDVEDALFACDEIATDDEQDFKELRPLAICPRYVVARSGAIYDTSRTPHRLLTAFDSYNGYLTVSMLLAPFRSKKLYVQALVAMTWLPPRPSPKHILVHLDRNRANNSADNLAWKTMSEACRRTPTDAASAARRSAKFKKWKLLPEQISEIRRRSAAGETGEQLASLFGVSRSTISNIIRNKTWTHVHNGQMAA